MAPFTQKRLRLLKIMAPVTQKWHPVTQKPFFKNERLSWQQKNEKAVVMVMFKIFYCYK